VLCCTNTIPISMILQLTDALCVWLQGVSFGWHVGLVFFLGWIEDEAPLHSFPTTRQNFLRPTLLPQDDTIIQLFSIFRFKMWKKKKKKFSPLPCSLNNWIVIISHSVPFVHTALLIDIAFCWLSTHICQYLHVSLVFPSHCYQVTPHHTKYVTPF